MATSQDADEAVVLADNSLTATRTTIDNPPLTKLRIVCISDTHNQTPSIPAGDILIHAGDLTNQGSLSELHRQINWLQSLSGFHAKIVVAGNHEITLDQKFYAENHGKLNFGGRQDVRECLRVVREAEGITYLCHESVVLELDLGDGRGRVRVSVFGSPYSPASGTWAFGYDSEQVARDLWSQIPSRTDVLITHTPPRGHRDIPNSEADTRTGCEELRKALWRTRPMLHVCGHMHSGRGVERVIWSDESADQKEVSIETWQDPGGTEGSKKLSLVDLTGKKKGSSGPLDSGRETCIVNAAVKAWSHGVPGPKKYNKTIVVDVLVPMYLG